MDRIYVLVRQVLASAWRQRWLLVATSWGLCIIGWAGVYAIPETYESNARLYVDTDAVLTPFDRLMPETAETLRFSDDVRNRHVLGTIVERFPKLDVNPAVRKGRIGND